MDHSNCLGKFMAMLDLYDVLCTILGILGSHFKAHKMVPLKPLWSLELFKWDIKNFMEGSNVECSELVRMPNEVHCGLWDFGKKGVEVSKM